MTWGWLKEIAAKSITVGMTALIEQGTEFIYVVFSGGATPIEYKALFLIFGYAVWTKVIVPRITDWFEENNPDSPNTAVANTSTQSRFDLI